MQIRDMLVVGMAARGAMDRQERERLEIAEREGYMAQVAALMTQGYSIEEAHSKVQDFYERQAQMQQQVAIATPRPAPTKWRDPWSWVAIGILALALLVLLGS